MGNLIETVVWSAGIPYFEDGAILTGGPDCPDNIPIQALANRTAFLKKQIDDAVSGALTVMYANRLKTARTITMSGDGSWAVSFDGNGNVTSAMTLANSGVIAGTYPVVTVDGKGRATAGRALQSADLPGSPALTGTPTAPTAAAGTNTTQIANTAFVQAAIAALIAASPAALDTLNELAAALGNDANFATTMTNALALKAPLVSPALTGNPTAPTPTNGDNDTSLATTAFVQALVNGRLSKSVAGGATVTLTAAEAGYGIIELTGALTANIAVVVPNVSGQWIFKNATSGAFTLTVKTAAGSGVVITQGKAWQVYCDGSNVVDGITDFKDVALSGSPTVPTPAPGTNNTQIANTAFVQAAIAALIASSPAALDTLNELATALGNDPNFATTMTNALAGKAPLASPALTGTPTVPTAAAGTSTTQAASTAFVQQEIAGDLATATPLMAGAGAVGTSTKLAREDHRHPTDTTRAPLASPAFTGTPTAPTAATGTSTTQLATTAFVQAAVAALIASSPAALDTLNELATALGNDPNFATTMTNALAAKAPLASPALTGNPTAPTPAPGDNDNSIATTGFVQAVISTLGLGINQTWQNVTASRAAGTTYYNTTERPIMVAVYYYNGSVGVASCTLNINGVAVTTGRVRNDGIGQQGANVCGIVPPGHSYSISAQSGTLTIWAELG